MEEPSFPDLPFWHFNVREISPGGYVAAGHDEMRRELSAHDSYPDAAIEQCKAYAREIDRQLGRD